MYFNFCQVAYRIKYIKMFVNMYNSQIKNHEKTVVIYLFSLRNMQYSE